MTVPAIGAAFDQVCFVVRDLDEAIDFWRRTNGVQRWSKAYDLAKHQVNKRYWGEPEDFQFSCAYGYAGDTLIELALHDGGRSIYADWLAERGGNAQHHIGFRLESEQDYHAACRAYADAGLAEAMAGDFIAPGGAGQCLWSYWDTRAVLGCYTELYVVEGIALEAMLAFRAGTSDHFIPGAPSERPAVAS